MKNIVNGQKNIAFYFNDKINIRYFTNVDIDEGVALVFDKVYCLIDARYYSGVKEELEKNDCTPILYKDGATLKAFLKEKSINALYVDYSIITVAKLKELKKACKKVKNGEKIVKNFRSIKTEKQLNYIKKACSITQKAFYELLGELKEGVTELEIKEKLIKLYLKHGADGEGFDTIVAFGENSAVPHHQTGDTALKKGMPVLIDTGCVVNGYISDYTRTLYFGTPSQKFLRCYDAVESANRLAIENITDGTTCKQADGYARDYLKGQGLAEYFTHSLGHGLGLEVHEYPTLSYRRDDELKNGMVFTIEPGVYFDGEFGIRIEDSVALMDGKVQRLYDDEKKLIIL